MGRQRKNIRLTVGERLRESERAATSMSLPVAVTHRLDLLAEAAKDLDATRSEIIGMLIAEAGLDPEKLELAILRYRKLKVADVLAPEEAESASNVISIKPRGPGRPAKTSSS
jgi:hypothetical protein